MRAKPLAGEVGLARGEPAPEGGDERRECAGGFGVAFEAEADDEPAEGVGVDRDDPGWEVGGHARSTPAGGDAVEGLHTLSFGRDCAGVQAGGVS